MVVVKTDEVLKRVSNEQFRRASLEIVRAADRGIQTAISDTTGRGVTVIGLNGARLLPDPTPDPLDELILFLGDKQEPREPK